MKLDSWELAAIYPPETDLPTLADVDVVVVGGGAAGVAAATVSAEAGLRVVLIERYGFAGGAAVAGMSGTMCGLYMSSESSSQPQQLVRGFAERFRYALDARGGLTAVQRYGKTWTHAHDPLMWRETADELLRTAGVRVIYHATVTGVLMTGDVHHGVIVESNAGRSLVRARRTIDASGDAAVISRAGYAYTFGDEGRIQNPTMCFRLGGVDVTRFLEAYGEDTICPTKITQKILASRAAGLDLPRQKVFVFTTPRPGEPTTKTPPGC